MPPRRLALVTARGVQLSLADQAVHDAVRRIARAGTVSQNSGVRA